MQRRFRERQKERLAARKDSMKVNARHTLAALPPADMWGPRWQQTTSSCLFSCACVALADTGSARLQHTMHTSAAMLHGCSLCRSCLWP